MLKMLRVGVLFTSFTAIAVIRFDRMGICVTVLALRLVLTRIRELGGA